MLNSTGDTVPTYEERYIAFLDILGFSNLVKESLDEKVGTNRIYEIIKTFQEQKYFLNEIMPVGGDNPRVYMFSDSICLTVAPTAKGLKRLFDIIFVLNNSLIHNSVLLRGSIVQGRLYEKDSIIFGPGLVEAYEAESKAAKYPRVLISNSIYKESQSIDYIVTGREPMPLSARTRRDFDGLYHLNWLCHFCIKRNPSSRGVPTIMTAPLNYKWIKENIESGLIEAKDRTDILLKWQWLASYFNEVIATGEELDILVGDNKSVSPIKF
ncbi:MAG: hypothetical protein R8G33_02940 [Gammaproteobacteria bacterium]|nr:hypothetical protein [Gammaproteobacteria bacterium]